MRQGKSERTATAARPSKIGRIRDLAFVLFLLTSISIALGLYWSLTKERARTTALEGRFAKMVAMAQKYNESLVLLAASSAKIEQTLGLAKSVAPSADAASLHAATVKAEIPAGAPSVEKPAEPRAQPAEPPVKPAEPPVKLAEPPQVKTEAPSLDVKAAAAAADKRAPHEKTSCYTLQTGRCTPQHCSGAVEGGDSKPAYIGTLTSNGTLTERPGAQFDFLGHCAVSVTHRFVYVHVPKSAGSSFHNFIQHALCKKIVDARTCEDADSFKLYGCGPALSQFKDFFWFSFVRHPFSRAVSAWQMALRPIFLTGKAVPFEEFAMDEKKLEQNSRLMAMHWRPQEWFIVSKSGCPVVDFVGLLAGGGRFERDVEFVLNKIGSSEMWQHWREQGFPRENAERGDRRRAGMAKSTIKGAVAEALYQRYETDFRLFGFNRSDAEYGQEDPDLALPLDPLRLDPALAARATEGMAASCYDLQGTCSPVTCGDTPAAPSPASYLGALKRRGGGGPMRGAGSKFDFTGHCAVSVKNRFIFVHVPKAAGTSFHDFLRSALCGSVEGRGCADADEFRLMTCGVAFHDYPEFFSFAFVRHPYERAVSAWLMALRPGFLQGPEVGFAEWAVDPSRLKTGLMSMHWFGQDQFLVSEQDCPVVDFVGLLGPAGRFEKDLEYCLGRIGSARLWMRWKEVGFPRENAEEGARAGEQKREAMAAIKGEVAAALDARYSKDFQLFGFDRHLPDNATGSSSAAGGAAGLRGAGEGAGDAGWPPPPPVSAEGIDVNCVKQARLLCTPERCGGGEGGRYIGVLNNSMTLPDRTEGTKFDFGGMCAVSIKLKFVFVHVPKAGGSSFHGFFRKALCNKVEKRKCDDEAMFQLMFCSRALKDFPDFFRFAFVRHPFSRAVSGWQMAIRPIFVRGPTVAFEDWARDPKSLQTILMEMHWYDQHKFVTSKRDCPIVDFVGLLAGGGRFERDLEYCLQRIGSGRLWAHWKEKGFPRDNEAGEQGDKVMAKEAKALIKGEVAATLFSRYEKDFMLFGFDRHDADYGQEYTRAPLPMDAARMDVALAASVTAGKEEACVAMTPNYTCTPKLCGSSEPAPKVAKYIGVLPASNLSKVRQRPKFDYGGQCAVSIKNRFMYLHVPKAGGSSMHEFLRDAFCNKVKGRKCDDEEQFKLMSCWSAFKEFPDFFKFSFVRHPFSRAVSSWQMAIRPGFLSGPSVSFDAWAVDPKQLKTKLMEMHWYPQNHFITSRWDCPLLDFVGLLEGGGRYERDLEYVFARIGSATLWNKWKKEGFPRENAEGKNQKQKSKEAKALIEGQVADALYERYRKDFELFGFDRHAPEYGRGNSSSSL